MFAKSGMSCMKGYVYTLKHPCCVVSHLAILTPKRDSSSYLQYCLRHIKPNTLVKDPAYPSISLADISSLRIPLPPITEQEKIVAELDCLTGIIEKKKQQLEELDNLARSIFYDMFGDPMTNRDNPAAVPLSSICTLNPKKSEIKGIDMTTHCSFVGMAQVGVNGEIDTSDIRSVQEVWTGFSYFKENDVLFAKITPCMENGKGAIARGLHNGIGFGSTEFHVLRPNEKISAEFIFYLLANKDVRRIAEGQMTGSGGQRRVPVSFFSIKTTLPPIDLQNRFALIIAAIEKQKVLVKQSIVETETLFNSRMDFWFNN